MPPIASKLKAAGIKKPVQRAPLWAGPESNDRNGGISFSYLSRWLTCRERFRVKVIEGWGPPDRFVHQVEYGNMWHVCEEELSRNPDRVRELQGDFWFELQQYGKQLCAKYPLDQEKIEHWYNVCKVQFPIYVAHWSQKGAPKTEPLFQEQVFNVPYRLPSGRTVYLRGKWDGGLLRTDKRGPGLWCRETKTKGDVDVMALQRQISYDLQTMIYVVALNHGEGEIWQKLRERFPGKGRKPIPVRGIDYNVVRRPLSGGKGTIRQHKPTKANPRGESNAEYYARLSEIIANASGEDWETPVGENWFFHRWTAEITPSDVKRFRERTLDPILEQLCDWYGHVTTGDPFRPFVKVDATNSLDQSAIHWQHPFGCENSVDLYGASDIDEYLLSGSTVGLVRSESLFRELQ